MTYALPFIAVIIGYLSVFVTKPDRKNNLKLLLAFSGAFLLSLTVFHLFPEAYAEMPSKKIGVFIMLGILLQIFLEFFSKGAEHGHVHISKNNTSFPWLLFISLSIHSLLEGFPIREHDSLVYGIFVHKLPISIILTTFFLESGVTRKKTFFFIVLFACMTPLGSLMSDTLEVLRPYENEILGVVIGIFLHISTIILFESSEGHTFNIRKLLSIILGVFIAYFI